MSNRDWVDTFIATADSRNTDYTVMEAIASISKNESEAEGIWEDGLAHLDEEKICQFVKNLEYDPNWRDFYFGDLPVIDCIKKNQHGEHAMQEKI